MCIKLSPFRAGVKLPKRKLIPNELPLKIKICIMAVSDDVSMFYGAKPQIFEKATILRKNMTQAEKLLWNKLKDRNLFPYKFRRQHPVDVFIVDFYCHPVKLVIEIDGEYHLNREQAEYDIGRSAEIESWGLKILRFTNKDVLKNLERVVSEIQEEIEDRKAKQTY